MSCGIYAIICRAEGPSRDRPYVGSSIDIERRWLCHRSRLRRRVHHSADLQADFDLYGPDAFDWEVVEECDRAILLEREDHWVAEYDAIRHGYNIMPIMAGEPRPVRPETAAKIAATLTGRQKTPEHLRAIGLAHTGRKHTPEQVEANRQRNLGRVHSPETRAKMSVAQRARPPLSEDTKARMKAGWVKRKERQVCKRICS